MNWKDRKKVNITLMDKAWMKVNLPQISRIKTLRKFNRNLESISNDLLILLIIILFTLSFHNKWNWTGITHRRVIKIRYFSWLSILHKLSFWTCFTMFYCAHQQSDRLLSADCVTSVLHIIMKLFKVIFFNDIHSLSI